MRSNPVVPKAVVRRYRDRKGKELFVLIRWDIDEQKRVLMGVYESLEAADALVRFDPPNPKWPVPKGANAFGAYSGSRRR